MMEKVNVMRALVSERLTAAAEEIFALVERTIVEYEEELCRSKEENQRKQQLLDSLLIKTAQLHTTAQHVQAQTQIPSVEHLSTQEKDFSKISSEELKCSVKSESEDQTDNDDEWPVQSINSSSAQPQLQTDTNNFPLVQASGPTTVLTHFKYEEFPTNNSALEIDATSDMCSEEKSIHRCNFCKKEFCDQHDLKQHIMVHKGEKPYSCSICARRFWQRDTMRLHMALHTRTKTEAKLRQNTLQHSGTTESLSKNRPYSCPVCNRCFTRPFSLQSHMVIHTGEKPFHCLQCNMRFNRKSNLKRHSKIHVSHLGSG